jgi:ABC-type sulfate transport system permease component
MFTAAVVVALIVVSAMYVFKKITEPFNQALREFEEGSCDH